MRLGIGFDVGWMSARRRGGRIVAGAVAMAAGSLALTAVHPSTGGAAQVEEAAVTLLPATAVSAPSEEATVAPPTVSPEAVSPEAVAPEAVAPEAVAPEAVAPETVTTTTTAPPAPAETATTTTAPAAPAPSRRAADAGPSKLQQVEAIADSSGWNWRAAGVRVTVAFHPEECCHWGVYDSPSRTLYIGPSAFGDATRLRYVVLHELGHAWQYQTGRFRELLADYKPFGMDTPAAALEAGGDCIAALWGAARHHYWACPAEARATAARRLAGDWR